jgi:ketopantoate reductase
MAVGALTRLETHKFLTDPDPAALVARLIRETAQLTAYRGIALEDHEPFLSQKRSSVPFAVAVTRLQHLGRRLETLSSTHKVSTYKVSTLQDLEQGRHLEVEEILATPCGREKRLAYGCPPWRRATGCWPGSTATSSESR